jgi:hypothetical protein
MDAKLRGEVLGHVAILAVCAAVIGLAAILQPSPEVVKLFGHAVPPLCLWKAITGVPCPGCGMTRSFAFLAHGDLVEAIEMNAFGPVMFVLVASQIPYRALRLWRATRA